MENIEQNKDIVPKQEDLWEQQDNRLNFLNNEKFSDIKDPLTKTINDLADDFDINTQEGYSIENDVLDIKGSINGYEIGFSYNMMEWKDTNLKADDHLHMNTTSNLFSLGVENGGQKQLGVKKTKILRHIWFYKKNTYSLIK